jgi:hypothetical protein
VVEGFGFGNRNAAESSHFLSLHPLLPPCRGGGIPSLCDPPQPLGGEAVEG